MLLGDRSDVEEGKRLFRLVQLHRRDLARDDLAKDTVGVTCHLEQCTADERDGQRRVQRTGQGKTNEGVCWSTHDTENVRHCALHLRSPGR